MASLLINELRLPKLFLIQGSVQSFSHFRSIIALWKVVGLRLFALAPMGAKAKAFQAMDRTSASRFICRYRFLPLLVAAACRSRVATSSKALWSSWSTPAACLSPDLPQRTFQRIVGPQTMSMFRWYGVVAGGASTPLSTISTWRSLCGADIVWLESGVRSSH